jgi:hypothetical protein
MYKSVLALFSTLLLVASFHASGQTADAAARTVARSANSESAESTARDLFVNGDYDKAVPMLERAAAEDPTDLRLLNVLGMAYLYSSSRIDSRANFTRVQPTMEKVIDGGGTATFLAARAMDRLKTKYIVKAISGELALTKGSLKFTPTHGDGETVGPLSKDEIKECGLNHSYGKDSNAFHIKTTSQGELQFRPLHFSKEEATVVCTLAAKYWAVKFVE